MKKIHFLCGLLLLIGGQASAQSIYSGEQGAFHAQGIAVDTTRRCVYISFTTSLVKLDMEGRLLGSVEGLTGHLGAISLSQEDGTLYGSLEYKHDAIGEGISKGLGKTNDARTGFYVALFDAERIDRPHMPAEEVMKAAYLHRVVKDYKDSVLTADGRKVAHRYGCSGVDGITVVPRWDRAHGEEMVYIAYGIYSDTTRQDNDYQVILQYPTSALKKTAQRLSPLQLHQSGPKKPKETFFVRTGNTTYGVQNMAYDPSSRLLFLCVYPGKKPDWTPFNLYVVDTKVPAQKKKLSGVFPPQKGKVWTLLEAGEYDGKNDVWGWRFPYGSTGICPVGGGRFYVSHPKREKGQESTTLHTYLWTRERGFVKE